MIAFLTPTRRETDDADLLLRGALAPLTGFGFPDTGVTLALPREPADATDPADLTDPADTGRQIELRDAEGAPFALVTVEQTYDAPDGRVGIVGPVGPVRPDGPLGGPEGRLLEDLHRSPAGVPAAADRVVVPITSAPTRTDLEQIAAAADGRDVVLVALAGDGRPVDLSATGLIRATLAAATLLPGAQVVVAPLGRRADPTVDARLLRLVAEAYAGAAGEVVTVGGTGPLPAAVAAAVQADRPGGSDRGLVVLLTGLSGSGKSTVARGLRDALLLDGRPVVTLLDGDVVRRQLSSGLGFSRQDRDTNIRRIGWVAAEIGRHGGTAICCPIAPFDDVRQEVRAMVAEAGAEFVLVHVATPLAECERRDRKGLYAKARRGEIEDFTGISSPYEAPADADLRIDTTGRPIADCVAEVIALLTGRQLLRPPATDRTIG